MDKFFGPTGILTRHLANYRYRPGQLKMAQAIAELLNGNETMAADQAACLVIEAETGLGKTLAYLIPAVLSGNRVVVSTNTRNLQDQIIQREIPLIQEHIAPDLKALCVKGRQNYLCLYRWHQVQGVAQADILPQNEAQKIETWLSTTVHADRSELTWMRAHSPLWQKICCLSQFCLGADCPDGTLCFLNRLRRDAANCRLLIVNHHLLFADLAVRRTGYGEVLPRYESVIFDEAHHVENVATTFFGFSFSRRQVLDLCGDIERSCEATLSSAQQGGNIRQAVNRLNGAIERFGAAFPPLKGRFQLHGLLANRQEIESARSFLYAALEHLGLCLEKLAQAEKLWQHYADRAHELIERLETITAEQFDDLPPDAIRHTYWYERSEHNLALHATPVDVATDLHSTLFSQIRHCVFTSATLTTGKDFHYFLNRLGLTQETPTLSLASPFDYPSRTLLYIPALPFPEPGTVDYAQELHTCMEELIRHAGGRTLALFTSLSAMQQAHQALSECLPYPLLIQGEAPRQVLLRQFVQATESVLFAVASFWEGVDVPGESLSLVIIDKLPFEVPSDPVIMARINRIKALGGNPFFEYQIPRAILSLRQGVGRLMRASDDRGIIAILDTRLFTKGYGQRFLKSLPLSPISRDRAEVAAFFDHQCRD
jgi:ATP-dependent DNA helicase DinG